MNRRHSPTADAQRCQSLLSDLRDGRPASMVAVMLRDTAAALGHDDIAAAAAREANGYEPADPLPAGVPVQSFAGRLGLALLESKIDHSRSTKTDHGNADAIDQISRTVEAEHLSMVLTHRRLHLRRLAEDLLARIGAPTRWVLSLHGIQTRGNWQKDLARHVSEEGLTYVPLDYNWFSAFRLLFEAARDRRVDAFRDEYDRFTEVYGSVPSIVAHSFGTYITARAMEKYGLEFDRVIFCGAIVRRDFPWSSQFAAGRVQRVLNDFGGRDLWARLGVWFIKDAGQSGLLGFSDDADGRVLQRGHTWFRHSDYFYTGNYRKRWLRFLLGTDPPELTTEDQPAINWRFRLLQASAVTAIIAVIWYFAR